MFDLILNGLNDGLFAYLISELVKVFIRFQVNQKFASENGLDLH